MRARLKPTWEQVQKFLPDIDQKEVNAFANSNGRKVQIATRLYHEGKPVLNATVHFYGTQMALYEPALALLLKTLEDNKLSVEWDAVSFLNHLHVHKRGEATKDHVFTHLIKDAATLGLEPVLSVFHDIWRDRAFLSKEIQDRYCADLCAILLGATATVTSEDIERRIFERSWHLPFTKFEPQGLEF